MKQGIFQEKAVESLSTPEQLDQRIKIIPSGGWIMFAAIVIGVAAALLWAFFGTVSSGANYQGVVFDYNDVLSVRAQQDGLLRDVLVEEGDQVARGDIIAVINNEESLRRISDLRNRQKSWLTAWEALPSKPTWPMGRPSGRWRRQSGGSWAPLMHWSAMPAWRSRACSPI